MLSTCPSCLNQILHQDGDKTVRCECGEAFSPFLTMPPVMDLNSGPSLMAMGEKHSVLDSLPMEPARDPAAVESPSFTDYSESEAAFAELRNFGEGLGVINSDISENLQEPAPSSPQASAPDISKLEPSKQNFNPPDFTAPAVNCLITAGDSLSGYEIESFLSPLSIWCSASVDSEDPLKQAHEILSARAQKLGANGVVSVRWSFTPDGNRILLTGTPVKCRKQS